jgi:hypothetical protein
VLFNFVFYVYSVFVFYVIYVFIILLDIKLFKTGIQFVLAIMRFYSRGPV